MKLESLRSIEQFNNDINMLEKSIFDDNESIRSFNGEIKNLSQKERFVEAQDFVEKRNNLTEKIKNSREKIIKLREEKRVFLENLTKDVDFDKMFQSLKVTQMIIFDPIQSNYEIVSYINSWNTIVVSLSGKNFESEAYHIEDWCQQNNFVVKYKEVEVVF